MKIFILIFGLLMSFLALAEDHNCEEKVLEHHRAVYHKTYKAASNTFLNNFVGRKNMLAHTFGYPDKAFLQLTITGDNYIADSMVDKAEDQGCNAEGLLKLYIDTLRSGELCRDLGDKYKKPRAIRSYLYKRLGVK